MTQLKKAKDKLSLSYIREKTENYYWKKFLRNYIQSIPYDKTESEVLFRNIPTSFKEQLELKKNVDILKSNSNSKIIKSYSFKEKEVTTRESTQTIPEKVIFETEENLLGFLDKEEEANKAKENFEYIEKYLPELKTWVLNQLRLLVEIEEESEWKDLIKVARYFLDSHIPNRYYIRELPIEVHTKFIEENENYLKRILSYILPEDKINPKGHSFVEKFYCKLSEELIHIKILDEKLKMKYEIPFSEFSIPLSEFVKLKFQDINILISENKTSIHLFQGNLSFENTIVIFGSGFGVLSYKEQEGNHRKPIGWLSGNRIFYWGDIDVTGLEILSKFKKSYPHAASLFMDLKTYERFSEYAVKDPTKKFEAPTSLNQYEHELYEFLKLNRKRLEQERLTHEYIKSGLMKIL